MNIVTKPKHPEGMTVGTCTSSEAGVEIEYFICQHCMDGTHNLCTGLAWDRSYSERHLYDCECKSQSDGYRTNKTGGTMDLQKELSSLLNRCSRENASNTPDYILAQYLLGCLEAFEAATTEREKWYGRAPKPSQVPLNTGSGQP